MCCKIKIFCVCRVRNCDTRHYFTSLLVMIFWVVAGCFIGFGGYIAFINPLLGDCGQATVALMIGFGVTFLISGMLACCWSCDEHCSESESDNCCLRFVTGIAIVLMLAVMITVAAKTLDQKSRILESIDDALSPVFDSYDGKSSLSHDVDTLQRKFHCCGYTGADDFDNKTWRAVKNGSMLPDSCCQISYDGCSMNDTWSYWDQSCRDVIERDIVNNLKYVGYAAICVVVFVILCSIISCCCKSRRINYKYPRTNDYGSSMTNAHVSVPDFVNELL